MSSATATYLLEPRTNHQNGPPLQRRSREGFRNGLAALIISVEILTILGASPGGTSEKVLNIGGNRAASQIGIGAAAAAFLKFSFLFGSGQQLLLMLRAVTLIGC
jgi:hypothetical protein